MTSWSIKWGPDAAPRKKAFGIFYSHLMLYFPFLISYSLFFQPSDIIYGSGSKNLVCYKKSEQFLLNIKRGNFRQILCASDGIFAYVSSSYICIKKYMSGNLTFCFIFLRCYTIVNVLWWFLNSPYIFI